MFNTSNRDNDRDPSSQQGQTTSSPVMSSTPDRAVHFKPPSPPPHDNQVSQSRENLVDQSLYNRSPGPQQASSPYPPPSQQPYNNYYNGYYPQQQPGYYYPPPHQAVPVNVQVTTTRQWPAVFTYITALGMLAVLIYELVYNKQVTGNVIETSPFNIMIGPSANTLILMGARFVPCMHETASYPVDGAFQCPNMTDVGQNGTSAPIFTPTQTNVTINGSPCTLQEVCGMTEFKDPSVPDQWYRFLSAIFLHSGVIHWLCNIIVHLSLGASMERFMNPLRYAIVWLASGAFGFIFGGVFTPVGNASMGCSGALFGIVALLFIDLFTKWKVVLHPAWELTKLIFLILISFVFGLLPGLDNFAHIGGFVAGLISGIIFFPIPSHTRTSTIILWVIRLVLLAGLAGMFYGMINLFYSGRSSEDICSWCKYLACLPINNMCDAYHTS
ncbi:hypothetical protein LRAMOSA08684 [Lichtheimia ramosa]|uniref:Rhomboid-type serine protease n=1 Tax=Lichtheimia ramosa TaxID=688394 RepID=A0A077WEV1_9FUNG|nr:hypothetical protein LRAMOSA08684 [Lichtheimia ramosa]